MPHRTPRFIGEPSFNFNFRIKFKIVTTLECHIIIQTMHFGRFRLGFLQTHCSDYSSQATFRIITHQSGTLLYNYSCRPTLFLAADLQKLQHIQFLLAFVATMKRNVCQKEQFHLHFCGPMGPVAKFPKAQATFPQKIKSSYQHNL